MTDIRMIASISLGTMPYSAKVTRPVLGAGRHHHDSHSLEEALEQYAKQEDLAG